MELGGAHLLYAGKSLPVWTLECLRMLANWGLMSNLYHAASWSLLGLKLEKDSSKMKAVNSKARSFVGLAKGVSIRIGSWAGTTNLMALPIDDFQVMRHGIPAHCLTYPHALHEGSVPNE
eukprot:TRINITY_DN7976_c2_g1_i5.p1 TRINITY_DN7976_c2_g1~~TRINITY_DN7976_c2_g1_i5.p1  ORF type:complete len:120 (-),score=12.89 TRINITY_DN7976_c2_g1_i5:1311-1670(-)